MPNPSNPDRQDRQDKRETTPPADMQPEDTGTAASGANERGAPTESVMKQEHKTAQEQGSTRPGGQR